MKITKITELDGTVWYRNEYGYAHREDGPAVIWPTGAKYWFINGIYYSYEEWLELTKDPISKKWKEFCENNKTSFIKRLWLKIKKPWCKNG